MKNNNNKNNAKKKQLIFSVYIMLSFTYTKYFMHIRKCHCSRYSTIVIIQKNENENEIRRKNWEIGPNMMPYKYYNGWSYNYKESENYQFYDNCLIFNHHLLWLPICSPKDNVVLCWLWHFFYTETKTADYTACFYWFLNFLSFNLLQTLTLTAFCIISLIMFGIVRRTVIILFYLSSSLYPLKFIIYIFSKQKNANEKKTDGNSFFDLVGWLTLINDNNSVSQQQWLF